MRAIISGVGHYVPDKILSNRDLEEMVDTNDEWITSRTGIKERRILDKEIGTSYMATKAAQVVLEETHTAPEDLDLILFATVTPDMPVPSAASFVQRDLGASNSWGYDINGGCTGFMCALTTGASFIESGRHKKVLVIGADKMSAITNYEDRSTCVLFGDGAGAVLLEAYDNDDLGIEDFILHLDGSGAESLSIEAGGSIYPASHETVDKKMHYIYQDGRTVFKHAVVGMADVSAKIVERNNLSDNDIRFLIPHQANYRIIDATAKKIGLDPERVVINISKYGNTTAATIPLALSETYRANKLQKGDWIVLAAFGAGFTWGSVLLRWAID
ncbi:MAG: beta-ketoacyl-ACP synthase III [Desulfobacterales bacterium]|nr:beta-ketoacyl-ACP synthase III [Desulfobacterales bacterium]